ncbi:hypothetical protein LOD99_14447 [Oopsacas minuta]|uniref:Uncharacterized protein n=1 Tax=Oopsacas minuta TaxID=111878 RepID=A0AAV7KDX7_9METZ|nr:hypothetical protein LOD99_14447 [Oopsacas minuta]
MKPELKKNRISDLLESSSDDGEVPIHSVRHRKHLDDLSLKQQSTRLSNLLECIKSLSVIENATEISIEALVSNKHVPIDKALFLLDLLEVGRRKYTQLRQTLLPDNIHFPSYSKLANLRDVMISRSSITLYPNPAKQIENCVVNVDIIRSMFDGKMAAILSGAGGASCQMCTATHKDLKDRNLVLEGFPINRNITDAIELFSHIDDIESFFALSTNERFNLTHQPISEINIHPASPLHSYTGVFRWFNLLVYHLRIEKFTWSPTSPVIKESMKFLQTFIQEKTGLKVNQPNSSGGTTSTGNVARRAFSDETEYLGCILSTVTIQYRPISSKIHTQASAIFRVFNSSHKANILELGKLCKDTYLVILGSFPWASMTPTLHKLLAHFEELIRESNSSYGLKAFSEEGTESCNKLVRKYRENLARKVSFETKIIDIFVRLTSQSDPTLVNYRRILTCERCGQSEHTTRSKCCNTMNNQKTSIRTLFTTLTSNTDYLS